MTTPRDTRAPSWRLSNLPDPGLIERCARLVGLRVLRIPGSRWALVLAGSLDRLRDLADHPAAGAPVTRLGVLVGYWRSPRRGWSAGVGPLPGLIGQRVTLPRAGRGTANVQLRVARPLPLRDLLGAALGALGPARPLPVPASADITAQAVLPGYLPLAPAARLAGPAPLPASDDIRAHDIVLRARGAARDHTPTPYALVGEDTGHGVRMPDGDPVVLVDAVRVNPRGRTLAAYRPDAPRVRLEPAPAGRLTGRWSLGGPAHRGSALRGLDAATLAALRRTGVVQVPADVVGPADGPLPPAAAGSLAALLAQLAMTGVVVHAPDLPAAVTDLLAEELRPLLAAPPPVDALAMELHSVRQRRAAMRGHAVGLALGRLTAGTFPELARPPSVSAILATRRREMLPAAVRAIVGQTYPELEVVVGLHGIELPEAAARLLRESGRPFEVVSVPARTSFGEVLGAATGRARGSLVTKFDDDDTYAAEHVWDLVLARHYSGATLVGKGSDFVHLENLDVTIRRSTGGYEAPGELVAGGTMLVGRGDLEAVGGWRPVPRSVDYGLLQRLRREGAMIYRTHPIGYIYHRRESGHTWDPGQRYFLDAASARWDGIPADAVGDAVTGAAGAGSGPPLRPISERSSLE